MTVSPATLASLSGGDAARLSVRVTTEESILLGAFQRARSCLSPAASGYGLARRRTGGPAIMAARRSVHVELALSSVSALVPDADVPRLLNRHVRPLLRGLTKLGALPRYGGRDFVSAGERAIAWVGFAHHQTSGAALFEAWIPVEGPFVLAPSLDGYPTRREAPYMGKKAGVLEDVTARARSSEEVASAIEAAYVAAFGALPPLVATTISAADDEDEGFLALEDDAIGFVGATTRAIGGDLFASEDLVSALSAHVARLARGASEAEVTRELGLAEIEVPGFIEGLRDPGALVRVATRALA